MRYMNLGNSQIEEKNSTKRLNYINNRIKILEKEIKEIKNKDNISFLSPNETTIKNNNIRKTIEEPNSYSIDKDGLNELLKNNRLFKTDNSKNKTKKLYERKKLFRKKNNYNYSSIINERKSIVLNQNTYLNNIIQKYNYIDQAKNNDSYNLRTKLFDNNNSPNKLRKLFILNQSFNNNNEKLNLNNDNKMEKLEYEFEIRQLKKKLGLKKNRNNELKQKFEEAKNINIYLENYIYQNNNKQKLLNDIIDLNKKYFQKIPNGLNNEKNKSNIFYENIILNFMELKFEYENNILLDEFIGSANKLCNVHLSNINNENISNISDINLFEKINELIDIKNNLNNSINKYQYLLKENKKYFIYLTSLMNNLKVNNISDLDAFIKNIYIQNIKEYSHMQKIRETLMNKSSSSKPKKSYYHSSNNLINPNIQNKNEIKNINLERINYYLINRRRPYHNLNHNYLNKTEKSENFENSNFMSVQNKEDKNKNFSSKSKNMTMTYSVKNPDYYDERRKKEKNNIEVFDRNFNKLKKMGNSYENKNYLFNEEDIEGINYDDNIKKFKLNKHLTSNTFKNNYYQHIKNHSLIIVNK